MASGPQTKPADANVEGFVVAATSAKRLPDGEALLAMFLEVTGADQVMWVERPARGPRPTPPARRLHRGAGCGYVRELEDIDLDVLRQLIAIAWAHWGPLRGKA